MFLVKEHKSDKVLSAMAHALSVELKKQETQGHLKVNCQHAVF